MKAGAETMDGGGIIEGCVYATGIGNGAGGVGGG